MTRADGTELARPAGWQGSLADTAHSWREMFLPRSLPADLAAGLSVACVALPLNLALAAAAGLPPGVGLVTGVVAGIVGGLLGSARLMVTGPEAALLPATAAIVAAHGAAGLAVTVLLAGLFQIALGLARVGQFIRLVPPSVVRGFTAGIGLLLLNTQLPRMLGVHELHDSVSELVTNHTWLPHVQGLGLVVGLVMAATMLGLPRLRTRIPAVLAGLVIVTVGSVLAGLELETVGALPASLPAPAIPSLAGVDLVALLPGALLLTVLASMGSLLATTSLETIAGGDRPANVDQELMAQGLANLASASVGGLPVMGAIVRATASVQAGARTRAASLSHAKWLLVAMLVAAPLVSLVPTAALAAILVVVGVRLLDLEGLAMLSKRSLEHVLVVVVTAVAIVATNFLTGVGLGLALAAALFLRRHGRLQLEVQPLDWESTAPGRPLHAVHEGEGASEAALVARVGGPLVFVNHMKLYELIEEPWPQLLVVDLARVPFIDAAGRETLQYLAEFLAIRGSRVAVVGASRPVATQLAGVTEKHFLGGRVHGDLRSALVAAGWAPAAAANAEAA